MNLLILVRRMRIPIVGLLLGITVSLSAQPPPAKRMPPAGIEIPDAARKELRAATDALRQNLDAAARDLAARGDKPLAALLPDAEVYHKAVDWALRYDEFFDLKQIEIARTLLVKGQERTEQLRKGSAPWTRATGVVIRGHRSRLDGSVQPYAVRLPDDWRPGAGPSRRLDVSLLGRSDKRTELTFIADRESRGNEIVPAGALVLTPYGRFCNATKFAGEVDVFEALAAVRAAYPVDEDRIIVRGFSMGGASTWHLAVHHPGIWAAASPGAGFSETAIYNNAFAPGKPERTWWEQKLWRLYDATGYAANLFNVPTVAYSGEIDAQKLAADLMAKAIAGEGMVLEHLIGPQTAHKYHPETKVVLERRLDQIVAAGRPAAPAEEHFTTYTLRYSESRRIKVEALEKSWERADVHLRVKADVREITTRNIAAFRLKTDLRIKASFVIDGQRLNAEPAEGAWAFIKENGRWTALRERVVYNPRMPRKQPGLSGPIDDVFMEPFLFVRPTGAPGNPKLAGWTTGELEHAIEMWRDIFRGHAPVKDDIAVTAEDIASKNLILWGDFSSNRVIAKLLASGGLPLTWNGQQLTFRGKTYAASHHVPLLIFPNPLSSAPRYIVLNSGVDFRDEAYGTNSLQTPKLPDFAIVDLTEPPGPRWPGRIVDAGFFDEQWK